MKSAYALAALPLMMMQCEDPGCAPQEAPAVEWTAGVCSSFAEEAAAAGLPWGTFSSIAWRESGCNPNVWVVDSDDTGGGLFGMNFRGSLAGYWRNLCGATTSNIRGNVSLQMECASIEYGQRGLTAWR